jgi:hypothetical protein
MRTDPLLPTDLTLDRRLVLAAPAYIVEQALAARLPAGHIKICRS